MNTLLSIGDFSRATHLSVKALRHYHEQGLLEPADIDETSGYRRYDLSQIPTAQVIRRFRDLDMPLDDIRVIVHTSDLALRNDLIARHLRRLEGELGRTMQAVTSLRELLEQPELDAPIVHRRVPAMQVAAISDVVAISDMDAWYRGALGEVYATVSAQGATPAGDAGGVYETELFADERGAATIFLPIASAIRPVGRVRQVMLPETELAVITHTGTHGTIDRAYGALADYVTRHALAVEGPLREFYPVHHHHTADATRWETQIGWPIFETRENHQGKITAS
jgi:DNA-binding transcriptional MerR regulator